MNADTLERPTVDTVDNDERYSHIVLEGWRLTSEDGEKEFIPVGNSVIDGAVFGNRVKALCGFVWVPGLDDPKGLPVCPACVAVARENGWSVPAP